MTTPNETNERASGLQESATYAQERAAATARAVAINGIVGGIRHMLPHLEALAGELPERAPERTQERPERLQASPVFLDDLTNWAEGVTTGITGVIDHALLSPEADFLWEVSADILNRYGRRNHPDDAPYQRLMRCCCWRRCWSRPRPYRTRCTCCAHCCWRKTRR